MSHDPVKQFIDCIDRGDAQTVLAMLRVLPELVNARHADCFGATALSHAVNREDRAMVDLLLDHGADIDLRSDWWAGSFGVLDGASDELSAHLLARGATLTPHAAARLGMIDELKRMLDADPSLIDARGGDGQLPLHFARTVEIAQLLLDRGAKIDVRDIDHASTAAQWRVSDRPRVARFLVERGAEPDPFMFAMIGDVARLADALRNESGGVNMRVTRQRFPAAPPAAGHIYLYTIGEGCTLLHAATNADNVASVRWLLANGADPNARGGYDDQTPLHGAAWNDAAEIAPLLIAGGADIDALSGSIHHAQPLAWAIVGGAERMAKLLLDAGAKLQPRDLETAKAGARGEFRQFSKQRPLEAWVRIERLIAASAGTG